MRPDTAGPGQESVWEYPRPPAAERVERHVEVIFSDVAIADTVRAVKVMETSHPPVYYVPPEDVQLDHLCPSSRRTFCEFKGEASYYDLVVGERTARDAAWAYANPAPGYEMLRGHIAFYPALVDECRVDGEVARPQPGRFYGGWVTDDIVGPFKGEPGTMGW